MTLSCYQHVKRTEDGTRPPVPPLFVDVAFLGDRSGSMATTLGSEAMKGGILTFVEEQKKAARENGNEVRLTVRTFDDRGETWIDNQDVSSLPDTFDERELSNRTYPRGMTALVDESVKAIKAQTKRIAEWRVELKKKLGREYKRLSIEVGGILVVFSDGDDTCSEWYKPSDLARAVREVEQKGRTVMYVASGPDAIRMSSQLGFAPAHTMAAGVNAAPIFRSMACAAARGTSGGVPAYTQFERQTSAPVGIPHTPPTRQNFTSAPARPRNVYQPSTLRRALNFNSPPPSPSAKRSPTR